VVREIKKKFLPWLMANLKLLSGRIRTRFVSGTTAVACKNLDRIFIAGAIEPEFCEMAEKRLL
jgi:hypothetical protein